MLFSNNIINLIQIGLYFLYMFFVCLYCMLISSTLRLTKFILKNFTTTTTTIIAGLQGTDSCLKITEIIHYVYIHNKNQT